MTSKLDSLLYITLKKEKKTGCTVHFVTDFRKLNSMIKRNPYPIPHIRDMLLKVSNFQFATSLETSLDLVMGFYNIIQRFKENMHYHNTLGQVLLQ